MSEEEETLLSLSSELWSPLKEEMLKLPPLLCQDMEANTHCYKKLKAVRALRWKPHLGSLTLDVEPQQLPNPCCNHPALPGQKLLESGGAGAQDAGSVVATWRAGGGSSRQQLCGGDRLK